MTPQPRQSILEIAPYVPGKSSTNGITRFKLSSNETPLGASPKAQQAYQEASNKLSLYPDGSALKLREAIAEVHKLDIERILCGAGSDELLNLIAHTYLQPSDETIYTEHGFLVYPIATKAAGGVPIIATEKNLVCDVDAILERVNHHTKIVFIANPNNPTGTYLPVQEINRLHAGLPDDVLLVLDGAYAEYVEQQDYDSGINLASTAKNVIVTRTFSKIYGLAGLRLGWCYANEPIIDALNRIRGPFNISTPALMAGIEAIKDTAFTAQAVQHNSYWLKWLSKELQAIGLEVTPSVANFVLVHFAAAGKTAAKADAHLQQDGIIIRRMESYGLPNALRISVGTQAANEALIASLKNFLESQ